MSSRLAAPVKKFRELSLETMAPTTRSQAHRRSLQAAAASSEPEDSNSESESDPGSHHYSSSSGEDDDGDDSNDDEVPDVVTSPSKLSYRVDGLPLEARKLVRNTFRRPPKMSLRKGTLHGDFYAFEMTELVHRSIRIGSPNSVFSWPQCSCAGPNERSSGGGGRLCEHMIWLHDQLVNQTLYDHDPSSPLTMTPRGYPGEIGDPFRNISSFHLDVLADGLHCNAFSPNSRAGEDFEGPDDGDGSETSSDDSSDDGDSVEDLDELPNRRHIQEIHEMLSAVCSPPSPTSLPTEDFRPDLLSGASVSRSKKRPVKRRDLEATVFRMLLANTEFFHYFLSKLRTTDPVRDPFRKLSLRVDHALRQLDAFASEGFSPSSAEGPCDVAWAARHITGVVSLIRAAIYNRDRPMRRAERTSAARALVHILAAVVDRNRDFVPPGFAAVASVPRRDRNLYLRLVGDRDEDFVIGVLAQLPDAAAPFVHSLEEVQDQLGVNGAPASYVEKFRSLVARLRRAGVPTTTSVGSKRQSEEPDRGSKRMK
ncbi:SWIM zinc finger protein [Colletotrichum plurivorum]|uniref:SWIM zinc finger protein n=1 Tax=Colletotrichum plurivorum TaxID=2175906 RepID=A0A8H6JP67_9PEZI|nr:SWIM zinc finger protein [Colletotrichum plurivorum]